MPLRPRPSPGSDDVRVTGRLLFGDDVMTFSGARATVSVEDTTYADARAVRLGSWTNDDVSYPRDADGVPFDIEVQPEPLANVRCSVRALIDVDRDGSVGRGDYVNVESILIGPERGSVDVPVRRVPD